MHASYYICYSFMHISQCLVLYTCSKNIKTDDFMEQVNYYY